MAAVEIQGSERGSILARGSDIEELDLLDRKISSCLDRYAERSEQGKSEVEQLLAGIEFLSDSYQVLEAFRYHPRLP